MSHLSYGRATRRAAQPPRPAATPSSSVPHRAPHTAGCLQLQLTHLLHAVTSWLPLRRDAVQRLPTLCSPYETSAFASHVNANVNTELLVVRRHVASKTC